MQRIFFVLIISIATLALPIALTAQSNFDYNHAEVGVFGDFYRTTTSTNLLGVGGRIGFSVHPNIKLEAGGAYDFEHNYTNNLALPNCPGGPSFPNCGFFRNGLHATHFSFGPKFQLGTHGPVRAFVFAKGGFVRFGSEYVPTTFGAFPTHLSNTDLNGTFYPGGGIEAFAGWFGIRADIGDEIYFDRGANNNLRITFGPVIRF